MAVIEIDYRCQGCGEEASMQVDTYYLFDVPNCPVCGQRMIEISREQEDPYEAEQDYNQHHRRY